MKDSEFRELVSAYLDGELDLQERHVLQKSLREDVERHREFEELSRLHRASLMVMGRDAHVEELDSSERRRFNAEKVVFADSGEVDEAAGKWLIRLMAMAVAASIAITVTVIGMDIQKRAIERNSISDSLNSLSEMAKVQAREAASERAIKNSELAEESSVEEIEAFLASMDASELQLGRIDSSVRSFSVRDADAGLVDRFQLTGLNSDSGLSTSSSFEILNSPSSDLLIIVP